MRALAQGRGPKTEEAALRAVASCVAAPCSTVHLATASPVPPCAPPLSPAPPLRAAFPCRYRGFIYTSFQERATKISHGNVGKLLAAAGDPFGAKICARIAGDEARRCSRAPSPHAPLPPSAPSRFLPYPTYTLPTPYLHPTYTPTTHPPSAYSLASGAP